jgi:cytochrome c-type biogenesis protein CcmH/NrfG
MTRTQQALRTMAPYDAFRWAEDLFEQRDYYTAATVLQHLVDTYPDERDLGSARELLARSYFHSAQSRRAADVARDLLERDPADTYAAVLLFRSLERSVGGDETRREEARTVRRLAEAMSPAA